MRVTTLSVAGVGVWDTLARAAAVAGGDPARNGTALNHPAATPIHEHVSELVVLFSAGLGLLAFGAAALLVRGESARWWVGTAAGIALALAAPAALGHPNAALMAVGVVLLAGSAAGAGRSPRLTAAWARAVAVLGRPAGRAVLLAGGGLALVAGSLARFEARLEAADDRDADHLNGVAAAPDAPAPTLLTDRGRPVRAVSWTAGRPGEDLRAVERQAIVRLDLSGRVIRTGEASDECNCHGWVFTGGRWRVLGETVEGILADNGYEAVSDPRPGDLAIYRAGGSVAHTAVVRHTGQVGVLVEGKWGWLGVFLHAPPDCPYGLPTYYRSPRPGHLLAGLAAPGPGRPPAPVMKIS